MLRSPIAMLSGSENCARMPPAARLVEPHASCVALEQADVDAGLGEMERDARADRAAPDDDDLRPSRERGHRRTRFCRKNPRFAGRSASRRMRYGYQSGPNGVATSTLYPSAAIERCSAGPHAVEHLELEPVARDALALGERLHVPDDRLVVRRDGDVRASAEAALDELDVRAIDVALLRVARSPRARGTRP